MGVLAGGKTGLFEISAQSTILIDQTIYKKDTVGPGVDEFINLGGTVHQADTFEELATKAGIGNLLVATITEFNRAIDEGRIEQFTIPKALPVNKIATPPFYPYLKSAARKFLQPRGLHPSVRRSPHREKLAFGG
ncbi:MAG: hypothetical protein HY650_09715 [Acidobacteria bacterium]|nr:hypothetical protein [Acidobacteriota bacterium]